MKPASHNIKDQRITTPICLENIAYILLWFPLSSETFIFREVEDLINLGLNIKVYTMYGKSLKGCSQRMLNYPGPITRMGSHAFFKICRSFILTLIKNPDKIWKLMRKGLFRKMRNAESQLENIWCFFAGFLLADLCIKDNIKLIHASWANGPATAAWVASQISGIPFAFTGRAGDIYPPDGILAEKTADALFVRANNNANVEWLKAFCPDEQKSKVVLIYNGLTFKDNSTCRIRPNPNNRKILAVGRFARTKGFPQLFTAIAILKKDNFPVELTLIGNGSWRRKLEHLRSSLNLENEIKMPGFIPNDHLSEYMNSSALLVVPSVIHNNGDRDGIPNVIMEALSMSMPVIATDVCGISEVIINGKTGLLIPQKDPAAIAGAIRQILENWQESAKMGEAGCILVKNMFDSKKNSIALMHLYEHYLNCNEQ